VLYCVVMPGSPVCPSTSAVLVRVLRVACVAVVGAVVGAVWAVGSGSRACACSAVRSAGRGGVCLAPACTRWLAKVLAVLRALRRHALSLSSSRHVPEAPARVLSAT